MTRTPPRVLLTGFGPFPGVAENESARVVKALAAKARRRFHRHSFNVAIIKTDWNSAPGRIAALIRKHRPSLALHFGVAREAQGFRIERQAANVCRSAADAAGALPRKDVLVAGGANVRPVTIDADAIAAHLAASGYPARVSDDAGAYLCNAVLYHSLAAANAEAARCRIGFIHIPADLSGPPLDFDRALQGSLEILEICLAEIAGAPRSG